MLVVEPLVYLSPAWVTFVLSAYPSFAWSDDRPALN